jgi:hypothetical protein
MNDITTIGLDTAKGTVTLTLASGYCATNHRCTPSPIAATGFQPRSSSMPFGYISGFR